MRRTALSRRSRLRRLAILGKRVYTGPSATVRAKVRARAGHCCEWPGCGRVATDLHHRLNRKQGGRHGARREQLNQPAWLLYACRAHHEHVTSAHGLRLVDVRAMGWVLTEGQDATEEAVHTSHGWVLLDNDGFFTSLPGDIQR